LAVRDGFWRREPELIVVREDNLAEMHMGESSWQPVNVFGTRILPETAWVAGYGALLERYRLRVPLPPRLAAVSTRHHVGRVAEDDPEWLMLRRPLLPADDLGAQLEFALRWEGVNLAVLNALFGVVSPVEIAAVVSAKPTGIYTRRLWFLYEWLTRRRLDLPDAPRVKAIPALDPRQQVALARGELSIRHRVTNNLPGTPEFCPLVRWTELLRRATSKALDERAREVIGRTHPDIVTRAAAFLLLSDSRSSFTIEGERPPRERVARWGEAIAAAGTVTLSRDELVRLQRVLVDDRFVQLGPRSEGGFVGQHDRQRGEPIPDHISARAEDLPSLIEGLLAYDRRTADGHEDPVAAAAALAFGFVYIHPFEDGNGRIHRWLIHHVLARAGFSPPGLVFPVSAAILREITTYKRVLESFSRPLLPFIEWEPTELGNVRVLNDTADYYRYFDATAHAEFLYRCVEETVERDLPEEVAFLEAYDRFVSQLQSIVDMPQQLMNLLHRFLVQNGGRLSKRARSREFAKLTDAEVERIERLFAESHARAETTDAGGSFAQSRDSSVG
jgi:hypothetical protein